MTGQNPDDFHNTETFSHEDEQPSNKRAIGWFLGSGLILVLAFVFISWYFFSSAADELTPSREDTIEHMAKANDLDPEDVALMPQPVVNEQQMPGNNYAPNSGRGALYDFFYTMFGGIEDGLDDNQHNLANAENLDNLNINHNIEANLIPQTQPTRNIQNIDDGYQHSLFDVVNSDVYGRKGEKAGNIYDILIDKETGEGKAVIVNQDGGYYDRELISLKFKNIEKQKSDGTIQATVTEDTIEERKEFKYNTIDTKRFISLRNLRDGQLLDYEGKIAGEVDAIIYANAEAQKIYFRLKPTLTPDGQARTFGIPYEAVNVVKNGDGYDVQFTKEQTETLARSLYGE